MSARALFSVALLAASAGACSGARPSPTAAPAAPIPDSQLGLAKGSVFDAPAPPAVKPNQAAPGELPVLPRMYSIAPPRIPHAIDDFLPITQAQNSCVDCHDVQGAKDKKPGEPTPIPASHHVDMRRAAGQQGEHVAGARWVCTSCHVPVTDAQPLLGSVVR
jgi:nitrate reductase (cytochrome), electron transfer subunit